jgi:hypothetical protein
MAPQKVIRCAVYTRKSTEHNLDLEFNSLDAQRESCEAYIKSHLCDGWMAGVSVSIEPCSMPFPSLTGKNTGKN